jgi:tetratricopeptide (TPR) repeat protein
MKPTAAAEKNWSARDFTISTFAMIRHSDKLWVWMSILSVVALAGCDRMVTSREAQLVKEADAKAAQGDFLWAINLYEAALDGTPQSAEVHYKLALLYDDKMNDPLHALHHFKRYLTLNANGKHADEVRGFMKRDEVVLATSLSGDSVLTRTEAARLRNENLSLRKQLEERQAKPRSAIEEKAPARHSDSEKKKSGGRSYVVEEGDTLASISRKVYKTSSRWKEILDANKKKIDDPDNLKAGQRLSIPKE